SPHRRRRRSGDASLRARGSRESRAPRCCRRRADATRSGSSSALHDPFQAPALAPRQRPALAHNDGVTDMGLAALVVRVQRARRANDLLVAGMPVGGIDSDGYGLGSAIGDHHSLAGLLAPGYPSTRLGLRLGLAGGRLPPPLFPQPRAGLLTQLALARPCGIPVLGSAGPPRPLGRLGPALALLGGKDLGGLLRSSGAFACLLRLRFRARSRGCVVGD